MFEQRIHEQILKEQHKMICKDREIRTNICNLGLNTKYALVSSSTDIKNSVVQASVLIYANKLLSLLHMKTIAYINA